MFNLNDVVVILKLKYLCLFNTCMYWAFICTNVSPKHSMYLLLLKQYIGF